MFMNVCVYHDFHYQQIPIYSDNIISNFTYPIRYWLYNIILAHVGWYCRYYWYYRILKILILKKLADIDILNIDLSKSVRVLEVCVDCVCIYLSIRHMHIFIYTHIDVHTNLHLYTHTHMQIYILWYVHAYINPYTHIFTYMDTCMHVCT